MNICLLKNSLFLLQADIPQGTQLSPVQIVLFLLTPVFISGAYFLFVFIFKPGDGSGVDVKKDMEKVWHKGVGKSSASSMSDNNTPLAKKSDSKFDTPVSSRLPVKKSEKRQSFPMDAFDLRAISLDGSLKSNYVLQVIEGAEKGKTIPVERYLSTFGRKSTNGRYNHIQLSSLNNRVSRKQGSIFYNKEENQFYIFNEADVPIRVNGVKIRNIYPLKDGDGIELGDGQVILLFEQKR